MQIYCANMGVEHSLSSYITGASLSNDLSMKKILFLHGFFATGSCPMARALKEAFEGTAVVLTPDLPLHPKEALKEIRSIIDREQPDLLLGNSCGSFLAQMLAPVVGIPALLGNPYFMMTEFLKERMVVYQALYGDQAYWVRPEDMFFGKVTRDGRTFNRFTEIDKF